MILRYIAVIAFFGWYLLVPPQTRTWWIGAQRYDDTAPLNRWTIAGSFDKAEACEAARRAPQQQGGDTYSGMSHAVCVATDDPRLKGN